MSSIQSKLDQFKIKFGKDGYIKHTVTAEIVHLSKSINDLRQNVENMLNSAIGGRLLESTKELIITFYNYLGHPKLQGKEVLFQEMLDIYNAAEKLEFTTLQKMNDLLNKLEIKLGTSESEVATKYKTPEQLREELEQAKLDLDAEKENLSRELKKIDEQKAIIKGKQEQVELDEQFMEKERESMKATFESEKQALATERANFESEKQAIAAERASIETEKQAIAAERQKLESERANLNP
jgi:chromosome segregation ATPase